MKRTKILVLLVATLVLMSCSRLSVASSEDELPVKIVHTDQGSIDFQSVFYTVKNLVRARLPNAVFGAAYFKSNCNDPYLSGEKITFLFKEIKKAHFLRKQQIIYASVVVDISNEKVDLLIVDETENYASTSLYKEFDGVEFHKMLSGIKSYINANKYEDCSLEISQNENYWHILVISKVNSSYLDEFGIDFENKIINIPNPISK